MTFVVMRGLCRSSRCCLPYATRAEAVAAIEAARWLGYGQRVVGATRTEAGVKRPFEQRVRAFLAGYRWVSRREEALRRMTALSAIGARY